MGAQAMTPAFREQVATLAVPHSLKINAVRQEGQKQLLHNFGKDLYVCYYESGKEEIGCGYKHYFITDRNWTIEFMMEGVCVFIAIQRRAIMSQRSASR